jgi:hypothetical protein
VTLLRHEHNIVGLGRMLNDADDDRALQANYAGGGIAEVHSSRRRSTWRVREKGTQSGAPLLAN